MLNQIDFPESLLSWLTVWTLKYLKPAEMKEAHRACHGWPEHAFSWRYQMPALAAGGYRVIVPNQRGYGSSSARQVTLMILNSYRVTHSRSIILDIRTRPLLGMIGERWLFGG